MNRKKHWDEIYTSRQTDEVSWYQREPKVSLDLIGLTKIGPHARIIDVGGGASSLVDEFLKRGFKNLTVLDISPVALAHTKQRLEQKAAHVGWIEANITEVAFSDKFDLWHDRAVFHFLTGDEDRQKYIRNLNSALSLGGHLILASFASDGPPKCSGLEVERYEPETLRAEVGNSFELVKSVKEVHITPAKKDQRFIYCLFKKVV